MPVSRAISRGLLWLSGLSSWPQIRSLTNLIFASVRADFGRPLPGCCTFGINFFNEVIDSTTFPCLIWKFFHHTQRPPNVSEFVDSKLDNGHSQLSVP